MVRIGELELTQKISDLSKNADFSSRPYTKKEVLEILRLQGLAIEQEVSKGNSVNVRGLVTIRMGKTKRGINRVQALPSQNFSKNVERIYNEIIDKQNKG